MEADRDPLHPPPAPDWVLGEDGHWKPPPFDSPRVGAAALPPAGPPTGAPPSTSWPPPGAASPAGRSGTPGWVWALVAGLVALPVLGVLALVGLVFLGTSSSSTEARYTQITRGPDQSEPDADPGNAFTPIPMDDGPDAAGETDQADDDAPVGLDGLACPDAAAVAEITGDGPDDGDPVVEATAYIWNDLDLPAEVCRYGQTTSVARITTDDPSAVMADVSASEGRFAVRRADVSSEARWVILSGAADAGSVSILFEHAGELWVVGRNGQRHDEVIALHDLVVSG